MAVLFCLRKNKKLGGLARFHREQINLRLSGTRKRALCGLAPAPVDRHGCGMKVPPRRQPISVAVVVIGLELAAGLAELVEWPAAVAVVVAVPAVAVVAVAAVAVAAPDQTADLRAGRNHQHPRPCPVPLPATGHRA